MARQWNRWSALAGLVLLLQLALSVRSAGGGGVCPSYPEDLTWKNKFSPTELSSIKLRKMGDLRLEGTFKQGPKVLLHKQESAPNLKQIVTMVLRAANPSNSRGVYKVSVILTLGFQSVGAYTFFLDSGNATSVPHDAKIVGKGTFDEATGELCVIGCILSVCQYKISLKYPVPKTILDFSVEGNLTSVGGAYFDPVSIHALSDSPLEVTKSTTLASVCPSLARDIEVGKLWNYDEYSDEFCGQRMMWETIAVTQNPECERANCSLFAELGNGNDDNAWSLRFERFFCQENHVQANLVFSNASLFFDSHITDPTADGTLLAEGVWNLTTGQLCMIACRLLSGKPDCEIAVTAQLSLTFTATQRSPLIGHVQSLRNETDDPLYFKKISFRTFAHRFLTFSGFKEEDISTNSKNQPEYAYTKVEKATAQCAISTVKKKKPSSGKYPTGEQWSELELTVVKDLSSPAAKYQPVFSVMSIFTRGNDFIDKTFGQEHQNGANVTGLGVIGSAAAYTGFDGITNVSYVMDYTIGKQRPELGKRRYGWRVQGESMTGEGSYDSNTGKLCLIGCRTVDLKQQELKQLEGDTHMDCQTFFDIQLPPKDSSQVLKGVVKSLRGPHDPLYFPPESFSGITNLQALDSLWRIDLEIVLSILMLSFPVAFLLRQILYSKRHPETLPYISFTMLLLFCFSHTIPLVLDIQSLLQNPRFLSQSAYEPLTNVGSWPEVNKIVVRFLTLLAMLLHLHLLQLVWMSRTDPKSALAAVQERTVLYYLTPLYAAGGLVAILLHALLRFKSYERGFLWRGDQGGVWWDVHAYGGLLLDFHLLPQVMANVLWDDSAPAPPLSKPFFLGMALVRSLPHLYDLGRQFRFIPSFTDMYLYANPEWEFYSVCADVAIPLVVMLLALLVALQQSYGGRCILPRRWRSRSKKQEYERVENSITDITL